MTIAEILEQAKKLTPEEREELAEQLRVMNIQDALSQQEHAESEEHWGKALNRLLDEIGPIEMKYPEIEDPVEWVKHLRAEMRRHRLGDLDEAE